LNPPLSLEIGDRRKKLTVKWTTWLYIDCCCDTCPTCQRCLISTLFVTDLIDKDSLPKLFYKLDDFLGILFLIEGPSDLSLVRQCHRSLSNVFQRPIEGSTSCGQVISGAIQTLPVVIVSRPPLDRRPGSLSLRFAPASLAMG